MKNIAFFMPLAASLAGVRPAQAQDARISPVALEAREQPSVAAAPPLATRWYGYQTGLSDVAAAGLLYGSVMTYRFCWDFGISLQDAPSQNEELSCDNSTSTALGLAGASTYLLGAPTVHAVHGSWDKAGLSLGMRLLPLTLGASLAQGEGSAGLAGAVLIGGSLLAMSIDHVWLAREEVPVETSGWYVAPAVDVKNRVAHVTVGASF